MRLAFTVDGTHEQSAGVEVRQRDDELDLTITSDADPAIVAGQVARVLSVPRRRRRLRRPGRT